MTSVMVFRKLAPRIKKTRNHHDRGFFIYLLSLPKYYLPLINQYTAIFSGRVSAPPLLLVVKLCE